MSVCAPAYINRNFENDFGSFFSKEKSIRIVSAALPFLTLYKPLSYPLSLAMGGVRLLTTGQDFWQNKGSYISTRSATVAAAVAGLAGTYFRHPLGLLIASLHDLLLDLGRLISSLEAGDYQNGMNELLHAMNDTLYVGLFLSGSTYLIAASLTAQFLIGISRSRSHFQKGGERLEGVSHLLMAFIRGHQAIRGWQSISIENEIKKAKEEGKPYLPLANRAQLFFARAGYKINSVARWTVRQIGHLILSPIPQERYAQEVASRVQTAVKTTFAIPIALAAFLISTPCYFMASYVGTGRFELFEPSKAQTGSSTEKVSVMFQNICGQDPWSVFSGGVVPPLEADADGKTRTDSIIADILEKNPDVYCGQEFDALEPSERIAQALAKEGYTCVLDTGCHEPIFNHSGLFTASKGPVDSFAFHRFNSEDTSGITSWCDRGVLEVNLSVGDKSLRVVNIHLNSGDDPADQAARLAQLKNYVSPLMQGPTLVVGDSNLDTSLLSESQKETIGLSNTTNALEGQITCTDEGKHILNGKPLQGCDGCEERIDVALYDPEQLGVSNIEIQPGNSDHHRISLEVKLLAALK